MRLDGFMAGCLSATYQAQPVEQVGLLLYAPSSLCNHGMDAMTCLLCRGRR